MFSERDEAIALAARAGFPRDQLPPFTTNAQVFWEKVAFAARSGVMVGGVRALLEAAAEARPGNGVFASFISLSARTGVLDSGWTAELSVSTGAPDTQVRRPANLRWKIIPIIAFFILGSLAYLYSASKKSNIVLTIHACKIHIRQGVEEISRGWVMELGEGEIHQITIDGENSVLFKCPPGECDIVFVIELHTEEIRHWILNASSDQLSEVSLPDAKRGAPEAFVRESVARGILDESRFGLNPPVVEPKRVAVALNPRAGPEPVAENTSAPDAEAVAGADTTVEVVDPPQAEVEPKVAPPASKPECEKVRSDTNAAKSSFQWKTVLKLTKSRDCWSGSAKLQRKRLRVAAFAETGDYRRCVREGGSSSDKEISARVGWCKRKLN